MRVLVVHAHPLRDSFAAVLRDVIVAKLREGDHEVDLCDLYGEGFDPVPNELPAAGWRFWRLGRWRTPKQIGPET